MSPNFLQDVEAIAKKVRDGLVTVFHAVEHEFPSILALLVNLYGKDVVSNAIATHVTGVKLYADKVLDTAEADVKALVQSTLVQNHGLSPTAAQLIASGIHHVVTIGEDKVNALIDAGANAAIADVTGSPTAAPPTA